MVLGDQFIGQFNSKCMIFLDSKTNESLVEAENCRGLYIVSKISRTADGMTFGETEPTKALISTPTTSSRESKDEQAIIAKNDLLNCSSEQLIRQTGLPDQCS